MRKRQKNILIKESQLPAQSPHSGTHLKKKKKEIAFLPRIKAEVERIRKDYLLRQDTIDMFNEVGMIKNYKNILQEYNKVLDGDLS